MFPKIKAFFHKKKLMFRLHVSFRETIHPVKVHWFALSNLTLTLMAVKLRSLRSRTGTKAKDNAAAQWSVLLANLASLSRPQLGLEKNAGNKNRKEKKNKRGKMQNSVHCIHIPSKPPPPPKGLFRRNKCSMRIARMAKIWSFRRLWNGWEFLRNQWLEIPQPTWDFGGLLRCFCCRFCRKKTRNVNFCRKKMQRKKIHNSYIDITYIDTYAKLHINQEKIYIAHIQIYMYMYIYIYI